MVCMHLLLCCAYLSCKQGSVSFWKHPKDWAVHVMVHMI